MSEPTIAQRAAKSVEDALDDHLKAHVGTMFGNLAGGTPLAEAAGMMKKGLIQIKDARDVALKVMAEVFGDPD